MINHIPKRPPAMQNRKSNISKIHINITTIIPGNAIPAQQFHILLLPALFCPGSSFATVAVAPPVSRLQLAVPHPYPLGQHPAIGPDPVPQRNQPVAQAAVVVAGTPEAGTAIVSPLLMRVVDEAGGGQEVVWQSRPVWQQPPPARARQA